MTQRTLWVWLLVLLGPVAVVAILSLLSACSSDNAQRAKDAVDLAGYQHALDACRTEGKDAGSYAVYERCASEADAKHGRKP